LFDKQIITPFCCFEKSFLKERMHSHFSDTQFPEKLFSVRLPHTDLMRLQSQIADISPNSKKTLYFYYSEFLLRANRNIFYRDVLNRCDFAAIDGKGLHWSWWRLIHLSWPARVYNKCKNIIIFRYFLILLLLPFQLVINLFSGAYTILGRINLSASTKNELVLGRDFIYPMFKIAEFNGWKTCVVCGGNDQKIDFVKKKLHHFYPKLQLGFWYRASDSELMKDVESSSSTQLSQDNLFDVFPDLQDAYDFLVSQKPDFILVALGGQSGKQEFFIDALKSSPDFNFTFATGVGAALDHLGSGVGQEVAKGWFVNSGLEWLHRFITQPYRRHRIWDSVFTLWWWTTIHQFMGTTDQQISFRKLWHGDDIDSIK
jgi:UDP-N-acetyl-D-mannosaminuronic acid transferase (WecB/TagA/CpsF family)